MQYKVRKVMDWLLWIYFLVLLVISPFYMQDKYSKLGRAKFELFRNTSIFILGLFVFALLLILMLNVKNRDLVKIGKQSLLDFFVLLYFIATVVSFGLSAYKVEAFWGIPGWSMGFFSQTVFVLIYFIVSRFWSNKPFLWLCAGVSTSGVFLIGILHRFSVDPFSLYEGLEESLQIQFLSTLGQATWYSSFLCICFPIGMGLYWYAQKGVVRFLAGIYIWIAMASLVTQNSDSAFFALGAVLLVLFWLGFENRTNMMHFTELCFIILSSFQTIGLFQQIYSDRAVKVEKISLFMSQSALIKIVLAILAILYVILLVGKNIELEEWVFVRNAVFLIVAMVIIGTMLFIYGNTTDWFYEKYGYRNNANYLKFDDNWGNGRGSSWKLAWKVLGEMSWKDRLFGVGPDSFSLYAYHHPVYAQILQEKWGESNLINVHNEFLNSMICYGVFGVLSYVGIFLMAFIRFIGFIGKRAKDCSPLILGTALSTVAYTGHNFFCYQQVLCTPYLFLFLGIGEAFIRKSGKSKIF